jgi:hypothetical protein
MYQAAGMPAMPMAPMMMPGAGPQGPYYGNNWGVA